MQLFQNLIGNAIKFRGERPPGNRRLGQPRRTAAGLFAVRDNGIGIERQYWDQIFVIFQRLHTRQKYPGTGIGLAICKRIVERHGGRIWLDSQPGPGNHVLFHSSVNHGEHHGNGMTVTTDRDSCWSRTASRTCG